MSIVGKIKDLFKYKAEKKAEREPQQEEKAEDKSQEQTTCSEEGGSN